FLQHRRRYRRGRDIQLGVVDRNSHWAETSAGGAPERVGAHPRGRPRPRADSVLVVREAANGRTVRGRRACKATTRRLKRGLLMTRAAPLRPGYWAGSR